MGFRGWPAEALEFYEGLEADNSRTYWQANRATYDAAVRAPMEALLTDLAAEFGEGRIFRPNRDTRFSRDKSPYKTNIAATLAGGGYVELSAAGLATGRGYWHLETDQLARYREAVADDATGAALVEVLAALERQGIESIAHSELKTAPRGYPKDHARVELLRRKGLAAWQRWPVAPWLGTAKAKDRVVAFLRAAQPVQDWLDAHVGR
jgi:uncharacterized protein (TIGR02453 family)